MGHWIALGVAIVANIGANIAFKYFVEGLGGQMSMASLWPALRSPSLWAGIVLGVVIVVSFLYAMRGIPLTIAYTAATCLSILGVTAAGTFLFGETLSLRAGIGMAVVLAGVVMLTTG